MKKQELHDKFKKMFEDQMNLDLSDVVEVVDGKFVLHMELLAVSMGSLSLDMTKEDHGDMATFIEMIQVDNPLEPEQVVNFNPNKAKK